MKLPATVRALLNQALELAANERGRVVDALFDSLAGHEELEGLMDELERRGDITWEPDMAEIERRLRSLEEPADRLACLTAGEVFEELSRRLAETRAERAHTAGPTREPRLSGRSGDLVGAALALAPSERAALAHAILETIERCDAPPDE